MITFQNNRLCATVKPHLMQARSVTIEITELEAALIMQGVSTDDCRWLLAFAWLSYNIPLIESDAQFDEYVCRAAELSKRLTAEGILPGMIEFARSSDGQMVAALLATIGEWQSRIERNAQS
jgi:hypothetical protein